MTTPVTHSVIAARARPGPRAALVAGLLALTLLAAGCGTSGRRTYYAQNASNVWRAAVAAAESPTYEDWHVVENSVQAYPETRRIEVVRDLRRTLHQSGAKPWTEQRTWQLGIVLDGVRPPTLEIFSRGAALPAHFAIERDRFFADVDEILAIPVTVTRTPAGTTADEPDATDPPRPAEPTGPPPVDLPDEPR